MLCINGPKSNPTQAFMLEGSQQPKGLKSAGRATCGRTARGVERLRLKLAAAELRHAALEVILRVAEHAAVTRSRHRRSIFRERRVHTRDSRAGARKSVVREI